MSGFWLHPPTRPGIAGGAWPKRARRIFGLARTGPLPLSPAGLCWSTARARSTRLFTCHHARPRTVSLKSTCHVVWSVTVRSACGVSRVACNCALHHVCATARCRCRWRRGRTRTRASPWTEETAWTWCCIRACASTCAARTRQRQRRRRALAHAPTLAVTNAIERLHLFVSFG